jgi:hypothetical protein
MSTDKEIQQAVAPGKGAQHYLSLCITQLTGMLEFVVPANETTPKTKFIGILSVSNGVGLFCIDIEVPIPMQPVTSNSASGDTGDLAQRNRRHRRWRWRRRWRRQLLLIVCGSHWIVPVNWRLRVSRSHCRRDLRQVFAESSDACGWLRIWS